MNLARFFSYTQHLEAQLQRERAEREQALSAAEKDRAELAREFQEERAALYDEIRSLRQQNLDLIDRICLQNRTIPVTERLQAQTPEQDQQGEQFKELLDQTIRRTGPVAAARQRAESALIEQRMKEEQSRRRVPLGSITAAAAAAAGAQDELADVMHQSD